MTDISTAPVELGSWLSQLERRLHRLRDFHLGHVPYVTLTLLLSLVAVYVVWQGGVQNPAPVLLEQGAKNRALVMELLQAWRLLTANLLHASTWHLGANAFFLLNVGGTAEAVFRRVDYVLILLGAALGTTLLSALFTTQTSCGASGLVFGAWGAINVFGLRHKSVLQQRYRRYFLRMVVPFSLFALYVGFAIPGVDNWGHLGGLLSGALLGWLLPSRLSATRERRRVMLAAPAAIVIALLLVPRLMTPALELRDERLGKLVVPVLSRAFATVRTNAKGIKAAAYDNGAGVIVSFEARPDERALTLAMQRFILDDLGPELERAGAQGMRISHPTATSLGTYPAERIGTEVLVGDVHTRTEYVVSVVDSMRYVVSVSAPAFLWPAYEATLHQVLTRARLEKP